MIHAPSIVIEVSAIFVAKTIFRVPFGGRSNTAVCSAVEREEWSGSRRKLEVWNISILRASSIAFNISIIPGRNTRIAPSSLLFSTMC